MGRVILDKKSLFDTCRGKEILKDSSSTTKQRVCRKGHGIVNSFRELSLTKKINTRECISTLWKGHEDGSLGDDAKSNESDCDSQFSDDDCLWEIYRSSDGPRSYKKLSPKSRASSPNIVLSCKTPPKSTPKKSPLITKVTINSTSPQVCSISPMLVESVDKPSKTLTVDKPSKTPVKRETTNATTGDTKKNEASPILKCSPKKISKEVLTECSNSPKSTITSKSPLKPAKMSKKLSKFHTKPISHYFQSKKAKLLSSPKLKLRSLKSLATPKFSSTRKSTKPTKSLSSSDTLFKGVTLKINPFASKVDSDVTNVLTTPRSKRSLKRHSSSVEPSSSAISFSTPSSEKRLCIKHFSFSEPRPKRKIDLALKSNKEENEIENKKAKREIQLDEKRPENPLKELFFTPLPNFNDIEPDVFSLSPTSTQDLEDVSKASLRRQGRLKDTFGTSLRRHSPTLKALKECKSCGTKHTPLWRDADDGTSLCNACGIRWKKYRFRCTRCWYIPLRDENMVPYCASCGHYNSVKRCNVFRRYLSSVY